jgi:hypothetical protein
MPKRAPRSEEHPRGTLFLMVLYGVVCVLAWFAVYLVYRYRGGVTP